MEKQFEFKNLKFTVCDDKIRLGDLPIAEVYIDELKFNA